MSTILAVDAREGQSAVLLPSETDEQLVYKAEFSKLLLRGIDIAEMRFTNELLPPSLDTSSNGSAVKMPGQLRITAEMVSKGWFRKLFGLHFLFRFESYIDRDSLLVQRTIKHDEQGKRLRLSEAIFDRVGGKIVWTERDPNAPARPVRVVTSALDNAAHDIISAFYYLRTQRLTPGAQFELVVSDSAQLYRIPVRVVEVKRLQTVLGQVSAVRVELDMFGEGRVMPGSGSMAVWFTADARQIPVRAQITNEIGTLEVSLKSISGGAHVSPAPANLKGDSQSR